MTADSVSSALLSIFENFSSAANLEQLCGKFRDVIGDIGRFYYALGRFRPHTSREEGVLMVHYPEDWQKHYHSKRYIDIDPTIDSMSDRNAPYGWDKLSDLDAGRQQLFNDVRDLGVVAGLTVPIHLADGTTFLASFAAQDAGAAQRHRSYLGLIAAQFLERHTTLLNASRPAAGLTIRERDCLTWTARGKSAWEIGVVLSISENTVNFHLKNACAKLDSKGRMLAVVKAIMMGVITP